MVPDVPIPAARSVQRIAHRLVQFARLLHEGVGTVHHPDPVRRATARALAYVLAALATVAAAMVLISPLAGVSWAGTIGTAGLAGLVALLWRLNSRGSLIIPWLFALAILFMLPVSFNPDTYLDVSGHPVTHLLFVVPVLIVTFFAHPAAGLIVIPLQVASLIIPVRGGYSDEMLLAFAATATLNLGTVYAIGASLSVFLRSSLKEMAQLNATLEERVAERTRDLSERNAQLDATRASLARTMRQVAHDIDNLLQARSGDGYLLSDAIETGQTQEALFLAHSVEANARVLSGLVSDLRDSGVAVTGNLTLKPAPVDMAALSRKVGEELAFAIQQAGISYTVEDMDDTIAWCDSNRVLRMMLNIVGNAVKFIDGGHQVAVRVFRREQWVVWECRDDGCGIAPEKLAVMGQEFSRLIHGDGAPGGTGIGLHFCGIIARLSGGDIHYYSAGKGQGTTVTVLLPACKESL